MTLPDLRALATNHLGCEPNRDAKCCRMARAVLAMLPVCEAAERQAQCDSPEAYGSLCRATEHAARAFRDAMAREPKQ